jgi:hypothetical protein
MVGKYITGTVRINDMTVNQVSTKPGFSDFMGTVMVRWGINRNKYRVDPGLYSVGRPDSSSDVFVTANYKLSFDHLRKNLGGINGWILVLDTKGVNVWCAAGKGTFGTDELNSRIGKVSLDRIVSHRRIILPQLAATGVAAHKIKEVSGFNVRYGPVRASDIRQFIVSGYRATKEMRRVTFSFMDRIKLIPNDFMYGKFYLLAALLTIFLLSAFHKNQVSLENSLSAGFSRMLNIFLAYFSGIVITPALLPYIPVRRFSMKGLITGILVFVLLFIFDQTGSGSFEQIAWALIIPAISSFMAMNFTGSSTFTSLSGVKKEMKMAVPVQIISMSIGLILFITGLFF